MVGGRLGHLTGKLGVDAGVVAPVLAPQVLGRVVGVLGDQLSVGGAEMGDVVPLEHVAARRLGHHDVVAAAHHLGQGGHVGPGRLLETVHLARVQPGRPAAADAVGEGALHAVALVHLDQVLADRRLLVLDQAGGKDRSPARHRPGGRGRLDPLGGLTLLEPGAESGPGVGRQHPFGLDPDRLVHHPAGQRARCLHQLVGDRRRRGRHPPDQVGAAEHLVGQPLPEPALVLLHPHRLGPQHEAREVELPLVGRHVGAFHVAELALVALVDHPVLLGRGQLVDRPVLVVDHLEQRREGRAQAVTQPASVAQVVHPGQLAAEIALVVVGGVLGVVGDGHWAPGGRSGGQVGGSAGTDRHVGPGTELVPGPRADDGSGGDQLTFSRPCVNRPAWLFSALARVSNHSPMESKPSSRAVRAKPGYISVYS